MDSKTLDCKFDLPLASPYSVFSVFNSCYDLHWVPDNSYQPVLAQGRLGGAAEAVGGNQGAELDQQCPGVEREADAGPVHGGCQKAVEAYSSDLLTFLEVVEI